MIGGEKPFDPGGTADELHQIGAGLRTICIVSADHAADRDAAEGTQGTHGRIEMGAADIVEIDIDAIRRSAGKGGRQIGRRLVIDHRIDADFAQESAFGGTTGGADNARAHDAAQLTGNRPDRARRRRDEQGFTRFQLRDAGEPGIGAEPGHTGDAEKGFRRQAARIESFNFVRAGIEDLTPA